MACINIVQYEDLLGKKPHDWVSNDHGMLVVCKDEKHSAHALTYLKGYCECSSRGLKAPGDTYVKIYYECDDMFKFEFIFMIPEHMSIESAIGHVRRQTHPRAHPII